MEFTHDDSQAVSKVIKDLNNGMEVFLEYTPIMIFNSDKDEEIVKKGLAILKAKLENVKKAEDYSELKQSLKVKKIVKDHRRKELNGE